MPVPREVPVLHRIAALLDPPHAQAKRPVHSLGCASNSALSPLSGQTHSISDGSPAATLYIAVIDENTVAEVAPILGFLRDIQRRFGAAVLLVHHARKSGATRPGQALRGSSELHAGGDSNLYLRRRNRQVVMTVEHRAAPGLSDIEIELADDGKGPALRLRQVETFDAALRPETPNGASSRRSPKRRRRSPSARSANAPLPGTRPSAPSCESSSAKGASGTTPRGATASSQATPRRPRRPPTAAATPTPPPGSAHP